MFHLVNLLYVAHNHAGTIENGSMLLTTMGEDTGLVLSTFVEVVVISIFKADSSPNIPLRFSSLFLRASAMTFEYISKMTKREAASMKEFTWSGHTAFGGFAADLSPALWLAFVVGVRRLVWIKVVTTRAKPEFETDCRLDNFN